MNKELSKGIINKSKFRNSYLKWPSKEIIWHVKGLKTNVIPYQESKKGNSKKMLGKFLCHVNLSGIQTSCTLFIRRRSDVCILIIETWKKGQKINDTESFFSNIFYLVYRKAPDYPYYYPIFS